MSKKVERPGVDRDQGLIDYNNRSRGLGNIALWIFLAVVVVIAISSLLEGNDCNGPGCGGDAKPRVLIVASRPTNLW